MKNLTHRKPKNFFDETLNMMSGDLTIEELRKIKGISPIALHAKEFALSVSIFSKIDTDSTPEQMMDKITYKNAVLLKTYLSEAARKIMSANVTSIDKKLQKVLAKEIKIARFLGLLPYVK